MPKRLLITNTFIGVNGERYNGGHTASFEDDRYADHIVSCGYGVDVGLEGEDKLREEQARYTQNHLLTGNAQPIGGAYADTLPPLPPLTEEEQRAEDEKKKAREEEEEGNLSPEERERRRSQEDQRQDQQQEQRKPFFASSRDEDDKDKE